MSTGWITSRGYDLRWYIGACIASYAMLWLHVGLGISAAFLVWFWLISVDGPHVFGTISRTYLDRQERSERGRLLLGSLAWFLVGPLLLGASILAGSKLPFFVFLTFAQLWAYWHVVRQHYGFMVLYQRKHGEEAGRANTGDSVVFYVLMVAPFISFTLRHPDARPRLGLPAAPGGLETHALTAIHALIAAAVILHVVRQVVLVSRGRRFNLPKNLFLMACIPLHLLIFLHPEISTRVDLRLFAVFVTYYHNIQYHGIIWFHARNRYHSEGAIARCGLAARVSRSFLRYFAAGLLFTITYRYLGFFLTGVEVPLGWGENFISEARLGSLFTVTDLAVGLWWGFAFNHYYLDQKIWKLSKDRRLAQDLALRPTDPATAAE